MTYREFWKQKQKIALFLNKETSAVKILIAELSGFVANDLYCHFDDEIPVEVELKILQALSRYFESGEPVQYILGYSYFLGLKLKVSPAVLIPRPETELLVETVLERLKDFPSPTVIDIGTGSGAIAIAIKDKLSDSKVTAVDISKTALAMAKENAKAYQVSINFLESDLFSSVSGTFDVLISNPPYIGMDEKIDPLVRNNEPAGALFAPMEGLYFYDQILKQSQTHLNPNFIIALEIPENKDERLKELGKTNFPNAKIGILNDYAQRSRIMIITNK